jgi:hypothetical protein
MAKRQLNYTFNSEWEDQYCFIEYKGKSVCLLCNGSVSIAKKSHVERHFFNNHKNFNNKYSVNSELRRHKVRDLKSKLTLRQSVLSTVSVVCVRADSVNGLWLLNQHVNK